MSHKNFLLSTIPDTRAAMAGIHATAGRCTARAFRPPRVPPPQVQRFSQGRPSPVAVVARPFENGPACGQATTRWALDRRPPQRFRLRSPDAAEVVDAIYDRIERTGGHVFISVRSRREVMSDVEGAAARRALLPLFGIPFGAKDNINVADVPTALETARVRKICGRGAPPERRIFPPAPISTPRAAGPSGVGTDFSGSRFRWRGLLSLMDRDASPITKSARLLLDHAPSRSTTAT